MFNFIFFNTEESYKSNIDFAYIKSLKEFRQKSLKRYAYISFLHPYLEFILNILGKKREMKFVVIKN